LRWANDSILRGRGWASEKYLASFAKPAAEFELRGKLKT